MDLERKAASVCWVASFERSTSECWAPLHFVQVANLRFETVFVSDTAGSEWRIRTLEEYLHPFHTITQIKDFLGTHFANGASDVKIYLTIGSKAIR